MDPGAVHIISASAGSGKTYRLTQLLQEKLRAGTVRPEGVVATTFTVKAATELRERVRSRLLASGRSEEAQRLGAARIGTVHSVCGGLVSEFAFELGLSPELSTLDEQTAKGALQRALSQVVSEEAETAFAALKERMVELDWSEAVKQVVDRARANGIEAEELEASCRQSVDTLGDLLDAPESDGKALDEALFRALEGFLQQVDQHSDDTKTTAECVQRAERARDRLQLDRPLPWQEWCYFTNFTPGARSRTLAEPVRVAAAVHDRHPLLRADLEETVSRVFALAGGALAAYRSYKGTLGLIDFTDQEVLALQLLRLPPVRERLSAELDLLLVDEFQDTSPLQLAIFLELASLAKESVWVGDQKQAIYGFRGTDPALMDAAVEALVGEEEPETLKQSWRSRAPLVELTSHLFGQAFAAHLPRGRVVLTPAHPSDEAELGSFVEYWRLARPRNAKQPEIEALATTLRSMLDDPEARVRDPRTNQVRRPRPRDVAVLCRSNAACQSVATELERRGVSAALPRAGVLSTPEGLLVRAGLRLWADPYDTLAMAELTRLTGQPEEPEAWLDTVLSQPGRDALAELPVVARLLERRSKAALLGPTTALEAVLDGVEAREWCMSWGRTDRRLANLDALRALAARYVANCVAGGHGCTVPGLVSFLEKVSGEEEDSQATGGEEDAVTVSTLHGAKGLEWPITVLYDLEGRPRASAMGVQVAGQRDRFCLEDPLGGRWIRYWPNAFQGNQKGSPFHERLEDHPFTAAASEEERREGMRLLYVAWTRARDRLVLAGRPSIFKCTPLSLLQHGGEPLLCEPQSPTTYWGGQSVPVRVVDGEVGAPPAIPRTAGSGPKATGPRDWPPAVVRATDPAAPSEADAGEFTRFGKRILLTGKPDMACLGQAVHGFLAADRPEHATDDRRSLAEGLLRGWGVATCLHPDEILRAADDFRVWAEQRWPGAVWYRELPLIQRLEDSSELHARADLVLQSADGLVIVDYKTFPGSVQKAVEEAGRYCGQTGRYAEAVEAATGGPVGEQWIALVTSGVAVRVG